MSRFIELHTISWTSGEKEKNEVIKNVDDIAMVIQQGDSTLITLRRSTGGAGDACFRVLESYEEVKRMLIGGEAQKVPKELRHEEQAKVEKMKAMISQPMNGLTDAEITATRNKAIQYLERKGYEVVNSYFKDEFAEPPENVNKGIYFLAKSLEKMSECTAVYFCRGAKAARGCRIEHAVAEAYGLTCIDEPEEPKEESE